MNYLLFQRNIKYFYDFTFLSIFNFALMALILLQFQGSDVDIMAPLTTGILAPEPYRAPPAS